MRKIFSFLMLVLLLALPVGCISQTTIPPQIFLTNTAVGTVQFTLTKLVTIGNASFAQVAATSDVSGVIGITTSGAGTGGTATVQTFGFVSCIFDGATAAGDYVQISSRTSGNCHDAGAVYPTGGQVIGRVLTTSPTAGVVTLSLDSPDVVPSAAPNSDVTPTSVAVTGSITLVLPPTGHASQVLTFSTPATILLPFAQWAGQYLMVFVCQNSLGGNSSAFIPVNGLSIVGTFPTFTLTANKCGDFGLEYFSTTQAYITGSNGGPL